MATPYIKPAFSVDNITYVNIVVVNDCNEVIIKEYGQGATVQWLCFAPVVGGAEDQLGFGQAATVRPKTGSFFRAGDTVAKIKTSAGTANFTWWEL